MPFFSYAQNFEDVLLWRALRHVGRGFYVDVGAQDPVHDSVSKGFYEQGWRGVHVEPSVQYSELLRKDRPDEPVIHAAVSNRAGLLKFFEFPDTGLSTGDAEVAKAHRGNGFTAVETVVTAVTLDQIFSTIDEAEIHWLKIDVEGFERAVLQGWRNSDTRPWIVVVEAIKPLTQIEDHRKWEPLLLAKGYSFVYFDGLNRYYISDAHEDLKKHFRYGPSLWDGFQIPEISRPVQALTARHNETLDQFRNEVKAKSVELGNSLAELERTRGDLSYVHSVLNETRSESERTKSELERTKADLSYVHSVLNKALGDSEQTKSDLDKTTADLNYVHGVLNQALGDSAQAKSEFEKTKAELSYVHGALTEARRESEQTKNELDKTKAELSHVHGVLNQAISDSGQLKSDLDKTKADLSFVHGALNEARRESEQTKSELDKTKSELSDVTTGLNEARRESEQTKSELDKTKSELSDVTSGLNEARRESEQTKSELDKTKSELSDVTSELNEARRESEQTKSELDKTAADLSYVHWVLARSQGDLAGTRDALDRTKAALADTRADLDWMEAELSAIQNSLWWRLSAPFRSASVRPALKATDDDTSTSFTEEAAQKLRPAPVADASGPGTDDAEVERALTAIEARLELLANLAMERLHSGPPTPAPLPEAPVALPVEEKRSEPVSPSKEDYIGLDCAWTTPLTWQLEEVAGETWEQSLFRSEVARALTALGHRVGSGPVAGPESISLVTALSSSFGLLADRRPILFGCEWQESDVPTKRIDDINARLAGVACASRQSLKVLLDHGVALPAETVGLGVDHWDRIEADPSYRLRAKGFRFLHLSSCDPSKGVDLLLESFGYVFSSRDDVSLVIKPSGTVFPSEMRVVLDKLRKSNPFFPDVVLIEADLTDAETKALYGQCQVFVAPSRDEGFCLPIAHAFMSGLPVVATAWGGHRDYCDGSSTWLVDFHFESAKTGNLGAAVWAEPWPWLLDEALEQSYKALPEERFAKAWSGRRHLLERFTWKNVAVRLAAFASGRKLSNALEPEKYRVGWLTPSRVHGVATGQIEHLLNSIAADEIVVFAGRQDSQIGTDKPENCARVWTPGREGNDFKNLAREMDVRAIGTLVIQHDYAHYNSVELSAFIESTVEKDVAVILVLELSDGPVAGTEQWWLPDLSDAMHKCHRILVRSSAELERLKGLGFDDQVMLLPSEVMSSPEERQTVATSVAPKRLPRGAFINTYSASCSIFESGRMVYNCIRESDQYTLDYFSLDMIDRPLFAKEGKLKLLDGSPHEISSDYDFWVFNWHYITMAMDVPDDTIRRLPGRKFTVVLELEPSDPLALVPPNVFDGFIALDPTAPATDSIFPFPRPLEGDPRSYRRPSPNLPVKVPTIGSFGYGTPGKGFELLVEAVNREFDKAIVRINVPSGNYTSWTDVIHGQDYPNYLADLCKKIAKPGIEVRFTHDFMSPEELVTWCAGNDLNCFMYTRRQAGLSATTDQAIMSGRPLLTSSNDTFRHVHKYIAPYPLIGLRQAIDTTAPLVRMMQKDWSRATFGETFHRMLASFGILSLDLLLAGNRGVIGEFRPKIAVASPRNPNSEDIVWHSTRVVNALSRSGKYDVSLLMFDDPSELGTRLAETRPFAVIVDAPHLSQEVVAGAVGAVAGPNLFLTNGPAVSIGKDSGLRPVARMPIVPYFTSTAGLRSKSPSIWLVGFSLPRSNLEEVIAKIGREAPDAEVFLEVPEAEKIAFKRRVAKLRTRVQVLDVCCMPLSGEAIIAKFTECHLIVFYNDPVRTDELQSLCSLAMTTERAVAFTRAAPFSPDLDGGTYVEDVTIGDVIALGMAAHINLSQQCGEGQLYARIDRLLSEKA
jgi:FkbM family methyltransferase